MSVSTDSNINEVRFFDLSPVSSSSDSFRDSVSVVDLVILINTPNVSISSDINIDHSGDNIWSVDLSPSFLTWLSDWTELLEPNIVRVVNTPQDWSITNRDIHKLTSDLVPFITFLMRIGSDVQSAHDFMVSSDTADLTVSDINVDEISVHGHPGATLVVPSVDSTSVNSISRVVETPDLSVLANGDVSE
jgi:hypothetical protein